MARIDDLLTAAVKSLGPKPADDAPQSQKNPWVGNLSNQLALAFDTDPLTPKIDCYHVADASFPVDIDEALTDLVNLVGERNFDLYEAMDGGIRKI